MNREEILRRAQNQKHPDEMAVQIEASGSKFALIVGLIMCFIIMLVKIYANVSWYDIYSIWATMMGAYNLYNWQKRKERTKLWLGLAWCLVGVTFAALYIVELF